MTEYFKRLAAYILIFSIIYSIIGFIFCAIVELDYKLVFIGVIVAFFISSYKAHDIISKDKEKLFNDNINKLKSEVNSQLVLNEILNKTVDSLNQKSEAYKKTLIEKSKGFPTLINLIDEYEQLRDEEISKYLERKIHSAKKSADIVREETQLRRKAQKLAKTQQAIVEYYEHIAPFLLEYRDEIVEEDQQTIFEDYTEEEKQDPSIKYLTKEEYRKLPTVVRNQKALDRFWERPKSKWLIGRLYERYIGYLYEEMGYAVDYVGIFKGYEDLGRDLICTKDNEIIVIQCKNWASFKTIYEKHIFQFFGTVFQFKDNHRDSKIRGIFYTTTILSDLAKRFASELNIEIKENYYFDQGYPCIKCNVSKKDGEKIYHLPFDQQYDKIKIEKQLGEFYCKTVEEAENKKFRRAFRWKSSNED